MLCRLLVTTIAISYLICVMLLSGLQKEDLDVNMLNNLQRHNVNIDDMNNVSIRAECLSKSSSNNTERSDLEKKALTTLAVPIQKEREATSGNSKETKLDAQTAITYLINAQIDQEITRYNKDIPENETRNPNRYMPVSFIKDYADTYTNTQKTDVVQNKEDTEHDKSQSNLENLLKYWNMYNTKAEIVTQIPEIATQRFIDEERDLSIKNTVKIDNKANDHTLDMEYIKDFLAKYISSHQTITTTTQRTNSRPIDIVNLSKQIKLLLRSDPITKSQPNIFDTRTNAKKTLVNSNNNEQNKFQINYRKQAIDPTTDKPYNLKEERLLSKNNSLKYIDDILKLNDQLKLFGTSQNTRDANIISQNIDDTVVEANKRLLKPFLVTNTKTTDNVYVKPNDNNNLNKKQFENSPEDWIKEIAQSIKVLVLKDLQKEIHTTASITDMTSIVTTTEKVTTVIQKLNKEKLEDVNHVIEKLMEMYQQFQSIKETTDNNHKMTDKNNNKQEHSGHLNIMYPVISSMNPYALSGQPANIPPVLINPYNPDTNMNTPLIGSIPLKPNSVNKITQLNIFNHKNEYSLAPITLQTNSNEIPPLGIPISEPVRVINQNIVVSTKKPFFETRTERQLPDYMFGNKRYNIINDESINRKHTLQTYFNPPPRLRDSPRHGNVRENRKDAKFQTRSGDSSNRGNGYHDHMVRFYTPRFDQSDHERIYPRSHEVKRFHERLERTDNWPQIDGREFEDREDCCKLKVASRQQLPLSEVKKRSRYDDTHFRNFLKTQEKVNSMLERILATKIKSDGPLSVETT